MRSIPILVVVAAVVMSTRAEAQEQAREARAGAEAVQSRFIGEWAYVPVTVVQGPYATSYASSTSGIGGYTLDIEFGLPPPIDARTRNLDYLALLQRFDGQIAFLDRLALRLSLQGEGVIPDTTDSALSIAINGSWALGGGLLFQLYSSDLIRFAITGDYSFQQRTIVSPIGAIEQGLQEVERGLLFTNQDIHRGSAGASFAIAFTPWLGGVAEAGWEGQWPEATGLFRGSENVDNFIDVAGAVSANAWSQRIPVGTTLFWRQRIPVGSSNSFDFSRQFGGGLFYTGRPWLDVGAELFWQEEEQEAGSFVRRASRYYVAPRIRGYF